MTDARPLPTFANPPVGEVVLGVQFQQLNFDLRAVGLIAREFESSYPRFEVQQPLEPRVERFDRPPEQAEGFSIELSGNAYPVPRLWLMDAKREELVQIQSDRLMHNWRDAGGPYPRYPRLRSRFVQDWDLLNGIVARSGLGKLTPTQCEVAYVNQVSMPGDLPGCVDPASIFNFIGDSAWKIPEAETSESVSFGTTALVKHGTMMGRLFVEVATGIRKSTKMPVYVFTLTVRGSPVSDDLAGALAFLDFARDKIVRTFADLTTPNMHRQWGKQS